MTARKIKLNTLREYDAAKNTSLVRELEMAVDRLVSREPKLTIQFFADLELFDLQEAKVYLLNFLEERGYHDTEAEKNFHKVFDRVVKTFEKPTNRNPALDGPMGIFED